LAIKQCTNKLFDLPSNIAIPNVIQFLCHLERSVGVSPYLHATLELQKKWSLNRHQCIALLYHCVTNESPYFFYAAFEKIQSNSVSPYKMLTDMSPVELGVWFHNEIQQLISNKKDSDLDLVLRRWHQPHNGRLTKTINIELSIQNLIELCDQFCILKKNKSTKQFYHSKAIGILMKSPQEGGFVMHVEDSLLEHCYTHCLVLVSSRFPYVDGVNWREQRLPGILKIAISCHIRKEELSSFYNVV
jgi:hypothetical protein